MRVKKNEKRPSDSRASPRSHHSCACQHGEKITYADDRVRLGLLQVSAAQDDRGGVERRLVDLLPALALQAAEVHPPALKIRICMQDFSGLGKVRKTHGVDGFPGSCRLTSGTESGSFSYMSSMDSA